MMLFRNRKLPPEAAKNLRKVPISELKPFSLLMAPAYVFMRANEKFVSLKGPLDFFTPEDLSRLRGFESVFFPHFILYPLFFQQVAVSVRTMLAWMPEVAIAEDLGMVTCPPTSYEISDAVLKLLAPLWTTQTAIEPFFVAIFSEEICGALPGEIMLEARDRSVASFERALMLSSWAVFLALHFGFCHLPFLRELRRRVFVETTRNEPSRFGCPDVEELIALARDSLAGNELGQIRGEFFLQSKTRASLKLAGRLDRARKILKPSMAPHPTIHGERGFADV